MVQWIFIKTPHGRVISITYRLVPIASISSIKTIDGACSSATRNNSLTSFGPSPYMKAYGGTFNGVTMLTEKIHYGLKTTKDFLYKPQTGYYHTHFMYMYTE